jgi:hypothetical protein
VNCNAISDEGEEEEQGAYEQHGSWGIQIVVAELLKIEEEQDDDNARVYGLS